MTVLNRVLLVLATIAVLVFGIVFEMWLAINGGVLALP
jgi:hypothetical protein